MCAIAAVEKHVDQLLAPMQDLNLNETACTRSVTVQTISTGIESARVCILYTYTLYQDRVVPTVWYSPVKSSQVNVCGRVCMGERFGALFHHVLGSYCHCKGHRWRFTILVPTKVNSFNALVR